MFCFTRVGNNGLVEASYTGRFSFVSGLSIQDAQDQIDLLAKKSKGIKVDEGLREESRHAEQYLKSKTGLVLSGLRWLVRVLWCVTRNKEFVRNYYDLRSHFYLVMYGPYEKEVGSLGDNKKIKSMWLLDWKVLLRWLSFSSKNILLYVMLLFFPFLILIGWVCARHFTVIVCEKDEDSSEIRGTNVSTGGIVNTIGCSQQASIIEKFMKMVQIERRYKNGIERDWAWMMCKFDVEKKMWKKNKEYISEINYGVFDSGEFEDYIAHVISFASRFSCYKNGLGEYRLAKICDESDINLSSKDSGMDFNDQGFKNTVNFFYMHGN